MSATLNKVFLIGNLTRDPELRYIPSGQAVTTFTIAVNRTYLDQSGQKKEEANFLRIVAWAKRAEICNQYLRKGMSVFVEGRLQGRTWQAQDGSKRTTIEVVAQNIQFLTKGGGAQTKETAGEQGKDEMVIDDSFGPGPNQSLSISPDELMPDNEVPF